MRTLVHLSDLHFGTVREEIIQPLVGLIERIQPDMIAISGDLTQRARQKEFRAAREFLDALPFPKIIVPGNHDIPLFNLFARFTKKLDRYRRFIIEDLEPFYSDHEIAVLGVNTARSATFKGGRVNAQQVARMQERLGALAGLTKIVVTHHPFDLPESYSDKALVGRARMAMQQLAGANVDLFLAGHLHVGLSEPTALRFQVSGHSALIIQAGTALSMRVRGEANSFNVVRIQRPNIAVSRLTWRPDLKIFISAHSDYFRHTDTGWVRGDKLDYAEPEE
ncbi:MAG: metallophosphoesterase [Deltaproteobacteria bacterium]|nr:metallophosphoesterase [Deltaproteobacteria bacterium]